MSSFFGLVVDVNMAAPPFCLGLEGESSGSALIPLDLLADPGEMAGELVNENAPGIVGHTASSASTPLNFAVIASTSSRCSVMAGADAAVSCGPRPSGPPRSLTEKIGRTGSDSAGSFPQTRLERLQQRQVQAAHADIFHPTRPFGLSQSLIERRLRTLQNGLYRLPGGLTVAHPLLRVSHRHRQC